MKTAHIVFDEILPTLEPSAQAIFLQLYRLSWGHGRETCKVGMERLVERANVGKTALRDSLKKLEMRGLVVREEVDFGSRWSPVKGSTYRVRLPGYSPSDFGGAPESGRGPLGGGPPKIVPMKESLKETHETAPVADAPAPLNVYDVRKIGARFRELHHGEADYTHERLRADVIAALVGQGSEVDERLLDEALG